MKRFPLFTIGVGLFVVLTTILVNHQQNANATPHPHKNEVKPLTHLYHVVIENRGGENLYYDLDGTAKKPSDYCCALAPRSEAAFDLLTDDDECDTLIFNRVQAISITIYEHDRMVCAFRNDDQSWGKAAIAKETEIQL